MSNKLIYPICLALVLALAGFAQAEILLNPDFEAGTDFWKTWGSGSGSGAGGYFWSSAYGATVIEDSTAQSGNSYIEVGFWPPSPPWWGYCYAFQEHPVTEGKTYQMSGWMRDGDADGAPSLIPEGGTIVWEWRTTAPVPPGDPTTGDRGDLVDIDGDGTGGNSDKIHYRFDLTEEWTYFSTIEVAPPGAKGLSVIFGTPTSFVNVDIDNASFIEQGGKARDPDPADGVFLEQTWATLAWKPGDLAVSHNVYMGDNFDDVNDGAGDTFRGNQGGDFYVAGFAGNAFPDGLVNGTTYYWRIDEVNDADPNSPWKGDVWSFTVTPKTAYIPKPADGAEFIDLNVQLTWAAGYEAKLHYIVFGEDFDDVNDTVTGTLSGFTNFNPGTLKLAKTYYWRVDESDGTETHKGEIWSFTTEGAVSGPNPANGAVSVKPSVTLRWDAGAVAASHEVYFGVDADAVANATKASPEYKGPKALGEENYDSGKLTLNTKYYWRIDEVNGVNPDSPWAGNVWSFTTSDFFVIDDFEDYDAGENQIWFSWHDGLGYGTAGTADYFAGNGTGAAVGDENTLSYTEETIVHGGNQSMPISYDNKQGSSKYSEVELTLTDQRDWTEEGVAELSLWFRGNPASVGSFAEGPVGTYTMTASGADIWYQSDEFHYAFKMISGPGSIIAKVESLTNTNSSAKAAVMIRDTLAPDSRYAIVAVTPGSGVTAEYRAETGENAYQSGSLTDITAPYWVKIERDLAGSYTAYSSANGSTWQKVGVSEPIQMGTNVYIGLAVTAHNASATCEAVFSNVTTTVNVSGQWTNQDIGIASNDAELLYVAVSNSAGAPAVVVHDDPAASQIDEWTEWIIPLQAFADQGIVLTNVDRVAIGLGTKGNMTVPGGSGKMYFDDILLYLARNAP